MYDQEIMIGELNRRVILKSWGSQQDTGGGAIATLLNMYTLWANVQARSGQPYTGEQQQIWNYDYKVKVRYEKSRIIKSNVTVDYDNKRLCINSISFEDEGNRKYCVLRCSTTDVNIADSPDKGLGILTYSYYGIDHEDNFTSDGSPKTLPNYAKDLRNRTIIGAFKDGIEFEVLLSGTPDPTKKQVLYTASTGQFTWSIPFEPNEYSLIQYI